MVWFALLDINNNINIYNSEAVMHYHIWWRVVSTCVCANLQFSLQEIFPHLSHQVWISQEILASGLSSFHSVQFWQRHNKSKFHSITTSKQAFTWASKYCMDYSPDTVEHRLFLGWRLGDGPLGAHYLALVLFFSCLAVFVLIGLGSAILS